MEKPEFGGHRQLASLSKLAVHSGLERGLGCECASSSRFHLVNCVHVRSRARAPNVSRVPHSGETLAAVVVMSGVPPSVRGFA